MILFLGDAVKIDNEQKRINEYVAKKSQEEIKRKFQVKMKLKQKIDCRAKLAEKLFASQPDIEFVENQCYQNAINDFAKQWNEQEKKKIEHLNRIKVDRIKTNLKEMEILKNLKEQQAKEEKIDENNRYLNEKLDLVFDQQQRMARIKRAEKLKEIINEQIEQRVKCERDEFNQNRLDTNRAIETEAQKDDEDFLNYANKLMNDVRTKGKPLFPLIKAIDEYKVQNSLLPQNDDLPHMKSHLDIGISIERKQSKK